MLDLKRIFDPDRHDGGPWSLRGLTSSDDLPPEWHLEWDERAAIMEDHGGLTREHAEAEAMKDILRQMKIENGVNST